MTTDDRRQEHPMLWHTSITAQRLTSRGEDAMRSHFQTNDQGNRERWRS
jgi:hypothetical protein